MASRSASTRLTDSWTRRGLLACALWPVSIVYRFLVALRRKAYQTGVFQSHRVSVPVMVVGNVVAGGAGKTPVVMLLVAHLQARGLRVGVVSRGYGRTLSDCREVLPGSLAQDVGDEPKLIQQTTGAPVFVARKRHDAANALLAAYPRTHLILCDDGLQHLALGRDLEICVFDERGARNGFLLPAGPLREPWPREVDFTLHSSSAQTVLSSSATTTGTFNLQRQLANYALRSDGQRISLENLEKTSGRPLAALAAIAHPERFFAMLRARGLKLQHTIPLPDHYDFNSWSSKLYETYTLVCTEKDAVKLWPQHPDVLAVPLVLCPEPGFLTALDSALDRLLAAALPGAS